MALVDVFYPGNPGKREKVYRLSSKLATLLESNFKRTNDLIDIIHRCIPNKRFSKVKVDHNKTIRHNCRVIQERLEEIQKYLDEKVGDLRQRLDPHAFDQLMATDTKFIDRYRYVRNIAKVVDLGLTIAGVVVTVMIIIGAILVSVVASIGLFMTIGIAGLAFSVLILGVDAIVSAIAGYFEKKRLEDAINELEEAIRKFEPVSDKFNKEVERLIIRLEDLFE